MQTPLPSSISSAVLLGLSLIAMAGCGASDGTTDADSGPGSGDGRATSDSLTASAAAGEPSPDGTRAEALPTWPEPPVSTFNGRALPQDEVWDDYSFAIVGHLRAGPDDPSPNQRMRDHTDRLLATDPSLVVSLGDMYYSISEQRLADFRAWVQDELPVPFFNAVGNHDIQIGGDRLADGSLASRIYDVQAYCAEFGATYYEFRLGSALFVFLDFESAGAFGMDEAQVAWLDDVLERAARDPRLENVFLFMHKVVWSYNNPDTEPLFRYRHPVPISPKYSWYADELEPRLEALPPHLKLYLFSGDIGGGNQHLQIYCREQGRVTFVAAGMGARDRDGFVAVDVKGREVDLRYVTLVAGDEAPLTAFGNEFWERFYSEHPDLAAKAIFPKPEPR
ncbi:metallophosphoesterase family protein [Engelhardtia mirabilis]|uniref:Calcineurin-like phosphoesterase n=1 Tax=Engelhardtia mirabilis TaxID=2528011 RepID=A0A518BEE0_9BACT|nr:Calcineurin-like phosphoesterase [Planctomycetes bacterium Pla133]QDU99675.1 Calcineurin-like phosphoesterase [Planctomycetes bacterium Pla86]